MAHNITIETTTNMGDPKLETLPAKPLINEINEVVISTDSMLIATTDTDETIEADWEHVTSEPSAPSTTETINPTPVSGSVPNTVYVPNTGPACALKLTSTNMSLHDMLHNPRLDLHMRLWLNDRGRSTIVSTTLPPEQALTHVSEMTMDLGEPFAPTSIDPQDSHVFGVGAWADIERPPM